MATTFKLSVVAPDRTVAEEQVTALVAPGYDGYFGIQANHEPMIVALRAGLLEYRDANNARVHVAIDGGFLEVSGAGAIVLADDAKKVEEIDLAATEKSLEEARKALRGESSHMTAEQATEEIERALARIKAARRS